MKNSVTRKPIRSSMVLFAAAAALLQLTSPATLTPAEAADAPTPEQLIEALKTKGVRGASSSIAPAEAARAEAQDKLIQRLKEKAVRGLSVGEREELAEAVSDRPAFDLEVNFDFNSAGISEKVRPVVMSLGSALQNPTLKGGTFLVAGHTDSKGRPTYNQKLSESRARAVKDFLVKNFDLPEENLVVVGYGQEKLKNPNTPTSEENRRVEVVNISPAMASAKP